MHVTVDILHDVAYQLLLKNPSLLKLTDEESIETADGLLIKHLNIAHHHAVSHRVVRPTRDGRPDDALFISLRYVLGWVMALPDDKHGDGIYCTRSYITRPNYPIIYTCPIDVEWIARHVTGDAPPRKLKLQNVY